MDSSKVFSPKIYEEALKDLHFVDDLNGDQFEIYMVNVLNHSGYHKVIHTPYSNDHGVDAYSMIDSISWQFKNFNPKNTVPFHAVEEVVFGAKIYGTKTNVVLTNSHFSKNTKMLVRVMNMKDFKHPIILIDRQKLFDLFAKFENNKERNNPELKRKSLGSSKEKDNPSEKHNNQNDKSKIESSKFNKKREQIKHSRKLKRASKIYDKLYRHLNKKDDHGINGHGIATPAEIRMYTQNNGKSAHLKENDKKKQHKVIHGHHVNPGLYKNILYSKPEHSLQYYQKDIKRLKRLIKKNNNEAQLRKLHKKNLKNKQHHPSQSRQTSSNLNNDTHIDHKSKKSSYSSIHQEHHKTLSRVKLYDNPSNNTEVKPTYDNTRDHNANLKHTTNSRSGLFFTRHPFMLTIITLSIGWLSIICDLNADMYPAKYTNTIISGCMLISVGLLLLTTLTRHLCPVTIEFITFGIGYFMLKSMGLDLPELAGNIAWTITCYFSSFLLLIVVVRALIIMDSFITYNDLSLLHELIRFLRS